MADKKMPLIEVIGVDGSLLDIPLRNFGDAVPVTGDEIAWREDPDGAPKCYRVERRAFHAASRRIVLYVVPQDCVGDEDEARYIDAGSIPFI